MTQVFIKSRLYLAPFRRVRPIFIANRSTPISSPTKYSWAESKCSIVVTQSGSPLFIPTVRCRFMTSSPRFFYRRLAVMVLLLVGLQGSSAQGLYVGTNYHPHDLSQEGWKRDIPLLKEAGFRVVRMGHLDWESCEPSEGRFDFAWFDKVMDLMHQAGIKVILDFSVRPAPRWLCQKFPSIGIIDVQGSRLYSNSRCPVDVGDPHYQEYAFRYAYVLTERYAKHPALLAFGIDNEPGDGPISYSETVRIRYIEWLKNKYKQLDVLNRAWSGRRGSRRIGSFEEIRLPEMRGTISPPERVLDLHRFLSHEVNQFLLHLVDQVNSRAPGALTTTNMWYYSPRKYSDYSEIAYTGQITRAGCGFYPGSSLVQHECLEDALFGIARIQFEATTPFWCTEFTTRTAVPGSIRNSAYASLMLGNQMICGWTWQTTQTGEEENREGLLDEDGQPNHKYDEYKKIAAEFRKIESYGFPYRPRADVALAFSYPSQIFSPEGPEQHDRQLQTCFNAFVHQNVDTRVVEISRSDLPYKLLLVPGLASIDEETAGKIRAFVHRGGTVLMTAPAGVVDEHGQVFTSRHPGRLSDVFGIRVVGRGESAPRQELSEHVFQGKKLRVLYSEREVACESSQFDLIEPDHAEVFGTTVGLDREYPIVTSNKYGVGTAIYLGLPAEPELIKALAAELLEQLGIARGPSTPPGVMARYIDPKHVLYLNLEGHTKQVALKGRSKSVLFEKNYRDSFTLNPFEPEFVELE